MIASLQAHGFSEEARMIDLAREDQKRDRRISIFVGNQALLDELGAVWDECKIPDWDGYKAKPIVQDTLRNAYRLLEALPPGLELPTIGAEPDGELTFEWHYSPWRTLSVSITEDGNLHYAALIGPNRMNGTTAFFGEVPQEIFDLIDQVYAE
jgi:hypothetical protein